MLDRHETELYICALIISTVTSCIYPRNGPRLVGEIGINEMPNSLVRS